MATTDTTVPPQAALEGGTYELIRTRLDAQRQALQERLTRLNEARKEVFGTIDLALLGTNRITTEHNCVARDLVPVGDLFLFGYNVHFGLKTETALRDVFACYRFDASTEAFHAEPLDLLADATFAEHFADLYRYYKKTYFARFAVRGPHLFMVFQVGPNASDIKTFKWLLQDGTLTYVDNRSDHEFGYPPQHEFTWQRATRDMHRFGAHPHVSIEDRVFVETVGGDLTVKVEDNTEAGHGIYTEPVDDPDQTLDDAQIQYAVIGNLILLKIRPYQERTDRYLVFNAKLEEVRRIDVIKDACVLLPEGHGIIFSNGYYLDTGEYKTFDTLTLDHMRFEKRVVAPNGEDFLYLFYNPERGDYSLLSYNLINQHVETPILCNGYALFDDGHLVLFREEAEPTKHHTLQRWQTPYVGPNYVPPVTSEHYLNKLGNKAIVHAMSEAYEVAGLLQREDSYAGLYVDLVRQTRDLLDAYPWLQREEAANLAEVLEQILATAASAIDEYEKVVRIRRDTRQQVDAAACDAEALLTRLKHPKFDAIEGYVQALADLRQQRGTLLALRDLRYADLDQIEALEAAVAEKAETLAEACVAFLLEPEALAPYEGRVAEQTAALDAVTKVAEAEALNEALAETGAGLDLLIEIVSNLNIDDATQTTAILDQITSIYAKLNQAKALLRRRQQQLGEAETAAEFAAQRKLLDQSVTGFLDVCDTPEACETYLTKAMVLLSEIESRFAEQATYLADLTTRREEIYDAFEARRVQLVEARNRRTDALKTAATRILDGIRSRLRRFASVEEIHAYFAADPMVAKVQDLIRQLQDLDDPIKADDLHAQLKASREEALRQLKDRQELLVDGENLIQFGQHRFSVNTQPLDLTTIARDGTLYLHLTGTDFFSPIRDPEIEAARHLWAQPLVSENAQVYRAEYLAYLLFQQAEAAGEVAKLHGLDADNLRAAVQAFMVPRYEEGYVKGVHDVDAAHMLRALLDIHSEAALLRYAPVERAAAQVFWHRFADPATKARLALRLRGLGTLFQIFPNGHQHPDPVAQLQAALDAFAQETGFFAPEALAAAGSYLFEELTTDEAFVISAEAAALRKAFTAYLKKNKTGERYEAAIEALAEDPVGQFDLVRTAVQAFADAEEPARAAYAVEAAALLFTDRFDPKRAVNVETARDVTGLVGDHAVLEKGTYRLDYPVFMEKLRRFASEAVPQYQAYEAKKKALVAVQRKALRLEDLKPAVLSSFVRNRLIDEVYLPLIGDNLAKQIGTAGAQTRTDRMGLLLLISPPGYGKTTLMSYIASRLGITFVKVDGPAIGHQVTSLDPAEAPNAAARAELVKLNRAFAMGDNVMIYLDDIQHCHPELLQKFIPLCDAQRRIEGVYAGESRSYDLRGKKVAVVMAGNPYTESGERFKIPDMLANRADTYNLGDIIGGHRTAFELSYLENALTSNATLRSITTRSHKDLFALLQLAEQEHQEGVELTGSYSPEEIVDIVAVLRKLQVVRDAVLTVNQEYIRSAAQADAYRTMPPFLLQGSYRNMNRLAEKVVPLMNEAEVQALIATHYENEAQILTAGAEANLLRFKELMGWLEDAEEARWAEIKEKFRKQQALFGLGDDDQMARVLAHLSQLADGLSSIRDALAGSEND